MSSSNSTSNSTNPPNKNPNYTSMQTSYTKTTSPLAQPRVADPSQSNANPDVKCPIKGRGTGYDEGKRMGFVVSDDVPLIRDQVQSNEQKAAQWEKERKEGK